MPGTSNHPVPGHQLRTAARALHGGGLVTHPTEGVWGLACNPHDNTAVRRLLRVKQRDPTKGLILIADRPEQLAGYSNGDAQAWALACAHWPGPSTWLLPPDPHVPWLLTGGHDRIALRVTAHPIAAALSRAFGGALVSTSANISRQHSARHAWQVHARLGHHVDVIIGGRLSHPGRPSSITDAVTGTVVRGPESNPA